MVRFGAVCAPCTPLESSGNEVLYNEDIQNIKKVLGLKQNKEYSSTKKLRYGYLMIMPDPDSDGAPFKGLLINLFKSFWPSLLRIKGFLVEFTIPIKKVFHLKNGTIKSFYSMFEYESWFKELGDDATSWKTNYYKGLGSCTRKEAISYFVHIDSHIKDFIWEDHEEKDESALELAFNKKRARERKTCIDNLQVLQSDTFCDRADKEISYNDFVNKDLSLFWRANVDRSIALIVDGLKLVQRKILFSSFKKNLHEGIGLGRLIGYVSEHSAYHHGDQSLAISIIGMAQDFVGSHNNINLLEPLGQYGTRNLGGKDHAEAKYLSTKLNPITRLIFPEDDDQLLNYLNEDERSIQPKWYIPIIPMVLVNGSKGIGTGCSSDIPNYNPEDIIDNMKRLLDDEECLPMDPWYRGFKGQIHPSDKGQHRVVGILVIVGSNSPDTIRIEELPIHKCTQTFKNFLESKIDGSPNAKDPFIESFKQQGDDTIVDFSIKIMANKVDSIMQLGLDQLLKKFKLTTTISTNNMYLLDADGNIKKYNNPAEIMQDFFLIRLKCYEERVARILANLEAHILILENKVKFILGIWEGTIEVVYPSNTADMVKELQKKDFTPMPRKGKSGAVATFDDYEYLLSLPFFTYTQETIEKLQAERVEKQQELNDLKNTDPRHMWKMELEKLKTALQVAYQR